MRAHAAWYTSLQWEGCHTTNQNTDEPRATSQLKHVHRSGAVDGTTFFASTTGDSIVGLSLLTC